MQERIHVIGTFVLAALLALALPSLAHAGTRLVAHTGTDGPSCGLAAATACRSISQAIALASPGDTIIVGPGLYGDLNRSGVLGDISGEETGSPGCSCVLSINKNVIVISSAGAAVTMIDGRSMNIVQTVVLLTNGGEFGRPGKGFTVTETGRGASSTGFTGHGIGINSANVMVRGNQVIFTRVVKSFSQGFGIFTVNDAAIRIEGNLVLNWRIGIEVPVAGAATVSKNQVIANGIGIRARGGNIAGNVATANGIGIAAVGGAAVVGNAAYANVGRSDDEFSFGGFATEGSGVFTFTKNNMFANVGELFCSQANVGLFNSVIGLNATNNYWGAPTGPGTPPADDVCNAGPGTTTTSPFATTPFNVKILKP